MFLGSIWESTTSLCMDYTNYVNVFWQKSFLVEKTQPTYTCSKLAIETLENGVKYVQT